MLKNKTFKKIIKRSIFSFLTLILSVIFIDISLRFVFFIKEKNDLKKQYLGAQKNSYYYVYTDHPAWVRDYLKEDKALKMKYFPYFEWKKEEAAGKCINILKGGIRKTWNPDFGESKDIKKIFCLGGSVIWGAASRDDFTIPSILSKKINKSSARYEVFNYGEISYTFTQEIVYLLARLKEGDVPYMVIFLDGFNDIFAAFDSGEAGTIVNLNSLRSKFMKEELSDRQMLSRGLNAIIEDDSGIIKAIKLIRSSYLHKNKIRIKKGPEPLNDGELMRLSDSVALDYKKNILLVKSLAKAYGFKCVFFLQPALPITKSKTKEELSYPSMKNEGLNKIYKYAYEKIRQVNFSEENFYDLSEIFDRKNKTMYIDVCHAGEEGNAMIADKILYFIGSDLEK